MNEAEKTKIENWKNEQVAKISAGGKVGKEAKWALEFYELIEKFNACEIGMHDYFEELKKFREEGKEIFGYN